MKLAAPVVVIGAGIMGCATAYFLARRGVKAVVLDQSAIGAEASALNAGGVRAQCRDVRERKLAMASVSMWPTLADALGMDVGYTVSGNLRLAASAERMQQLQSEAEDEWRDQMHVELWDRDMLRRRAPYLADVYVGAKYCASDGVADPKRTTLAFYWAAQRLGAVFLPYTRAEEILTTDHAVSGVFARQGYGELVVESPAVLHVGGPWTAQLSQTLGLEIPMHSIRLAIGLTAPWRAAQHAEHLPFLSDHDLGLAARPAVNGQFYVSGFGDPAPTFSKQITPAAMTDLERIDAMIPGLQGVPLLQVWAGLLDVTPDEAPVIDKATSPDGYFVAAGFSGHGFCLGPIIGQLLSEWILDGAPSMNLDAFRLDRFDRGNVWNQHRDSSVIAGRLMR